MANLTVSPALSNSIMDYDYENDTVSVLAAANTSMSTFDAGIELLANSLHTYYTPLLVLLGSIGNVISVYVFFVSKLRMQSTSLYLSVLAISDTIFLIQLLPPWLNAMQITNLFHRPGFCQVIVYSTYASCCCSAWLVVAFTVERYVAVLYPLRRNRMCTVTRAKTVIGVLVLGSMVANLPVLKYASPSVNDCNIDSEYIEVAARFNVADTMVSFTLPLGLIILLNSRIVAKVWRRGCERRAFQAAAATRPHLAMTTRRLPPMRSQQRVTRMLLLVSSVFVVLNVPAYAMRIAAYAFDMNTGEYSGRWAALQQLALTFFNTNFGINFILYCLSGQNFRRELCQSVPCLRIFKGRIDDLQLNARNVGRASSVTTLAQQSVRPRTGLEFPVPRVELNRIKMCFDLFGRRRSFYESAHESGTSFVIDSQPPTRERRHHSEPVIARWTFDNSRATRAQLQPPAQPHPMRRGQRTLPAPEEIEMRNLGQPQPSFAPDILPVYRIPEPEQPEDEERERTVSFVLFPFTRLIAPKKKRSSSIESGTPSN